MNLFSYGCSFRQENMLVLHWGVHSCVFLFCSTFYLFVCVFQNTSCSLCLNWTESWETAQYEVPGKAGGNNSEDQRKVYWLPSWDWLLGLWGLKVCQIFPSCVALSKTCFVENLRWAWIFHLGEGFFQVKSLQFLPRFDLIELICILKTEVNLNFFLIIILYYLQLFRLRFKSTMSVEVLIFEVNFEGCTVLQKHLIVWDLW